MVSQAGTAASAGSPADGDRGRQRIRFAVPREVRGFPLAPLNGDDVTGVVERTAGATLSTRQQ